jgi:adenine/guanine phosphoribosyltransferase-like PRPP-binding protein
MTSDYLYDILTAPGLKSKIRQLVKRLRSQTHQFDSIAFRGMSGAIICPLLAARLNKNLIMVRKPNSSTHSTCKVEGDDCSKRYIIVDDFLCTGDTVKQIVKDVCKFARNSKLVGVVLYSEQEDKDVFDLLPMEDDDWKEILKHVVVK